MSGTEVKTSTAGILKKIARVPVLLVRGELLLALGVERFIFHILYTFLVVGLTIWVSLEIDTTLLKVENNNRRIHSLQIELTEKRYDLAVLERRSNVAKNLKRKGSAVAEPEKAASLIQKQ